MKRLLTLFAILIMVAGVTSSVFSAEKRVLVEDHTGAWCGWCVVGIQAMEDLLAEYPDKFIPVAVHNGDNMATTLQTSLASTFAITGYPSGVINRKKHDVGDGLEYGIHPAYWSSYVPTLFTETSPVDLSVTYNVNATTKQLTATVTAKMDEAVSSQLCFNLFILEDGVTGTGTGWDQANYLSGNSDYSDHPFYSLPNPVTGIIHDNVMRDMLGGALGTNGSFPATAEAGQTYTQEFSADLNSYEIQNINKIWVVAVVTNKTTKEIVNSTQAGKVFPKPKYGVSMTSQKEFINAQRSNTFTNQFTVSNTSSVALDVNIAIDADNTYIPADWTVSLDKTSVNLAAGSNTVVTATVQTGANSGFGTIAIKSTVTSTEEYDGKTSKASTFALTDGYEYLLYYFDANTANGLYSAFNKMSEYAGKVAFVPYSTTSLQALKNYDCKGLIIPSSFDSRGAIVSDDNLINYLNTAVNSGKSILMTSSIELFFLAGNATDFTPSTTVSNFFKNTWGINGLTQTNPYKGFNSSYYYIQIPVVGTSDDTKDISFNVNGGDYNYAYFDQVKILDATKVTPIYKYNVTDLTDETNVAGVKIVTPTNKNIFYGFGLETIADATTQTTVLGNMMKYLDGSADVEDLENLNAANINVYPNPVLTNSTISFNSATTTANAEVYVVDEKGARVMTISNSIINEGNNELQINANNLTSGKYFVVTRINGVYSQYPFVVNK